MKKALIGKKIGMTQIFDENGVVIPVTVIEIEPNREQPRRSFDEEAKLKLREAFWALKDDDCRIGEIFRTTDWYYIIYIVLDQDRIDCAIEKIKESIEEAGIAREIFK